MLICDVYEMYLLIFVRDTSLAFGAPFTDID